MQKAFEKAGGRWPILYSNRVAELRIAYGRIETFGLAYIIKQIGQQRAQFLLDRRLTMTLHRFLLTSAPLILFWISVLTNVLGIGSTVSISIPNSRGRAELS